MKRYRVLDADFDTRATVLSLEIGAEWTDEIKATWLESKAAIRAGLELDFGSRHFERKLKNFLEVGPLPFSILAFHNAFLRQSRNAFVIGAYYPALTGACALGERILNHLLLLLRDDFKSSPDYKKVYAKASFDDWEKAIDILAGWGVLLPDVARDFKKLKTTRNEAIHFKPDVDKNDRSLALRAIQEITAVVQGQFSTIGPQPWFIPEVKGTSFIKRAYEADPFVKKVYLPNCALVGPLHLLDRGDNARWIVNDSHSYEDRVVTDDEFRLLFETRATTLSEPPPHKPQEQE